MKRLRVDKMEVDTKSFKKGFVEMKPDESMQEKPLWFGFDPSFVQTYTTQLMLNKNMNFYKAFYAKWDAETQKETGWLVNSKPKNRR